MEDELIHSTSWGIPPETKLDVFFGCCLKRIEIRYRDNYTPKHLLYEHEFDDQARKKPGIYWIFLSNLVIIGNHPIRVGMRCGRMHSTELGWIKI
jgi:hypothetical protein